MRYPGACDEIAEVIQQPCHVDVSGWIDIFNRAGSMCVVSFVWIVFFLKPVNCRFECFQNAVEIDRVGNLALVPIADATAFLDDTVGCEFTDDFIVDIEVQAGIVGCDSHQDALKVRVAADMRREVLNVDVRLPKNLRVRREKVLPPERLVFWNVQFLREYLCKPVHQHRLSICLSVEVFNHIWCECLAGFLGILREEFLHLFEGEISASEIRLGR